MTIAISDSKCIKINNEVISFYQFRSNSINYLQKVKPLFRESTTVQKDGEDFQSYLKRLFYHLYYKKGYSYTNDAVHTNETVTQTRGRLNKHELSQKELSVLNALGINVIKCCPKTTKILFKNSGNEYKMNNDNIDVLIKSITKSKKVASVCNDVKFGVELEFVGTTDAARVELFNETMKNLFGDKYNPAMRYNHNKGNEWVLGRDSSVHGRDGIGYELTTPILSFGNEDDMHKLDKVIRLIKVVLQGHTTRSCGTHVHMSFNCGSDAMDLRRHFATAYSINENTLFDRMVPVHRRGDNNHYCTSVDPERMNSRYRKLNLLNVSHSQNMHVEFRQLDGTLDIDKIEAWVKLQKLFIDLALSHVKDKTPVISFEDIVSDTTRFNEKDVESMMCMCKLVA